jgi:antitoxin ParD1/3/4
MTVTLSPHAEEIVRELVEAGRYGSTDEVIERALQALDYQERLERLRDMVQVGIDAADRGEVDEWTPELRDRLRREAAEAFERGDEPDPDVLP